MGGWLDVAKPGEAKAEAGVGCVCRKEGEGGGPRMGIVSRLEFVKCLCSTVNPHSASWAIYKIYKSIRREKKQDVILYDAFFLIHVQVRQPERDGRVTGPFPSGSGAS